MTQIDIYSGFLGAGKTTLIKKLVTEAYKGQKLCIIENEFGEIGIDGGFLQDAGVEIREMNSGCICCSLVGDFGRALTQVISDYAPDRNIIEPSGVGKLSDVNGAVEKVTNDEVKLGYTVAVVDASKVKVYMKNFGEFYNNQVETASCIILSRSGDISQEKMDKAVAMLREHNQKATIVTTPWDSLTGEQLTAAMDGGLTLAAELAELARAAREHDHEHHHHHEDGECCGHHHDHEEDHEHHHHHEDGECCGHHHDHEEEHEHHHHHEDGECCHHDHDHEHHHEHDENCTCGCHDHHHHHHADEVFTSWGVETSRKFTMEGVEKALHELDTEKYGLVLRAKGILPAADGNWIHFDFVPEEYNLRLGGADITGKLCVIGSKLDEKGLAELFGV